MEVTMNTLLEKLSVWNKNYNDVPRRLMLIVITVLTCFIAAKVFPYCWPTVLAFMFASLMEPVARVLRKLFRKFKAARSLATLLCMFVLFGVIMGVLIIFANRIITEAISFISGLPGMAKTAYDTVTVWITDLYMEYSDLLPENFLEIVRNLLNQVYQNVLGLAANLTGKVTWGTVTTVISTATSLPYVILTIVLTIMCTFYLSYDRERIANYFKRTFPGNVVKQFGLIKNGVIFAIFGQIRAQLFISFVLMLVVIFGLIVIGKRYALLMGLIIGIADALPVVGAGLIINTWTIIELLLGNYSSALGLFVVYLTSLVVRQTIEPRIVGKQLGLYPLVTMMSMFAGFQMIGVLGLIAGPVVANICRVVLDADAGRLGGTEQETPFVQWIHQLKQKFFKKKTDTVKK